MATVKDIITRSLRYVGQSTQFLDGDSDDYNVALDELNSMLSMWYKLGLRATLQTSVLKLQEVFPYPEDTHSGIAYNLAVQMFPLFNSDGVPSPLIIDRAKESKNDIWVIYGPTPSSVFPGTLPTGAGNTGDGYYDTVFYPDCDDNVYAACDAITSNGVIIKGVKHDS